MLLKQGLVLLPPSLNTLGKTASSKYKFKGKGVAKARPSNPRRLNPRCSQLGLGRLLFSTYNFNASSEKGRTNVAMARLYLPSSMVENYFSTRGHVAMTYLCACYLGFKINKFISKCKNTNLQPFNQEVLQEKHLHIMKKSTCKP